MTGDIPGPRKAFKGGGGTQTTTQTQGIAPEFKPAVKKTTEAAASLYDTGQLGRVADTSGIEGAYSGLTDATKAAQAAQQSALSGAAGDIRREAGNITADTSARRGQAIEDAQQVLGGQRQAQALTGGLGGARALRANNQLASRIGSQLAAQDEAAANQAAAQRAQLYGQAGQLGAQAGALGTQGAEAALIQQQTGQQLAQQKLDAPGQALAQYGQLLQSPASFQGGTTTTTAPRGGK